MKMKTMNDLLTHELKDIYSAEKQLTKALPKMAKACSSDTLRQAFEMHLRETQEQIHRLEQIAGELGISLRGHKCEAMEGLIEEAKSILEEDMDEQVQDAALIAAAQRVEHYEIAAYGCARTFAELLEMPEIARTLQQSLDEEGATDKKLTEIAVSHINERAMQASEA